MISRFRRSNSNTLRAGVTVDDDAVAVALVERDGDSVRVKQSVVSSSTGNDWPRRASAATAGVELRRVPVTAVVGTSGYQLVLVECPQVPAEEVADAVRWRIKDLVGFATDDAVIDTIDIPQLANQSSRPMVYAVAAEADSVERQVDAVIGAGLSLDSIDIPEMCLHNIATCLPEEPRGVALLHFDEEHGTLILSRAGVLYLIRRIDTGLRAIRDYCANELTVGDVASEVTLEVQRSLDYFESHYDQRPITDIVLGPGAPPAFPGILAEQLGLNVAALDLNDAFNPTPAIAADQQPALIVALGAALRIRPTAAVS